MKRPEDLNIHEIAELTEHQRNVADLANATRVAQRLRHALWKVAITVCLVTAVVTLLGSEILDNNDEAVSRSTQRAIRKLNKVETAERLRAARTFRELEAHRIRNERLHYFIACLLTYLTDERSDFVIAQCERQAKDQAVPKDGQKGKSFSPIPGASGGRASPVPPPTTQPTPHRPGRPSPRPSNTASPRPTNSPSPSPSDPPPDCIVKIEDPITGREICVEDPVLMLLALVTR